MFGVEIELESEPSDDFVENVTDSDIIAGWDKGSSPERNGVELQTNILNMSELPDSQRIVDGIPEYGENAGGHIHVSRTPNQCASRWYWALRGLDGSQCRLLNMRHMSDDYWRALNHGSMQAGTRPSTTNMRVPSNHARSAVGMRVPPASLSRPSGGYAPCGGFSKSTPVARSGQNHGTVRRLHGRQRDRHAPSHARRTTRRSTPRQGGMKSRRGT